MAKNKAINQENEKQTQSLETKTNNKNTSNSGLINGLIVGAIIAVVCVIVAVLCRSRLNDTNEVTEMLSYSDSFFVSDDEGYSLWNSDGKRLTNDNYTNRSDFVSGHAMVKKDNQYGIIGEDGRMLVDYGKYGMIDNEGGLYLAEDGNTKEQFLITGSGRILANGIDLDVYTPASASGFAGVKSGEKFSFFSHDGALLFEFDNVDGAEEPEVSNMKDFGMVYYNNKTWVFDARDGKIVASFEGPRYGFDGVPDSRKLILLSEYSDSNGYKLIVDGKIYDLNETKYYDMTDLDQVIGYDNFDELALLDDDYKVARRVSTDLDLKDTNNYAIGLEDGGVEIYRNGERIKEFDKTASIATSGILYSDYYAVRENDKAKFYNLDGSEAFGGREFQNIRSLFDKHGNAIVADSENEYYLFNKDGNRVNDTVAKRIRSHKGGYEVGNVDGKYAIMNKDGKLITDFKYTDVFYRDTTEPRNIWTGKIGDGKYDIIDVDNEKVIAENVKYDNIHRKYFTIKKDGGGVEYYTLDGNKFYETK